MADSLRLAILKQICTHLETDITLAGEFDVTGRVFRGRRLQSSEEPVPALSVLDGLNPDREPDPAGKESGDGKRVTQWVLLIKGIVEDDIDNPTDPAEQFLAHTKQSLSKLRKGVAERTYTGTALTAVISLDIEPGTVRPAEEIEARASFWLRIAVSVVDDTADPFFTP